MHGTQCGWSAVGRNGPVTTQCPALCPFHQTRVTPISAVSSDPPVDVQQAANPVDAGRADGGVPPPEAPPRGGGGGAAGRRARAAQVPRHHLAGGPGRAPHPGHLTHQTMIAFLCCFLRYFVSLQLNHR